LIVYFLSLNDVCSTAAVCCHYYLSSRHAILPLNHESDSVVVDPAHLHRLVASPIGRQVQQLHITDDMQVPRDVTSRLHQLHRLHHLTLEGLSFDRSMYEPVTDHPRARGHFPFSRTRAPLVSVLSYVLDQLFSHPADQLPTDWKLISRFHTATMPAIISVGRYLDRIAYDRECNEEVLVMAVIHISRIS
jgi:hypothetical protein